MKKLKKLISLLLTFIMAASIFAGCGSDPVLEEFESFLNVQMVEVNASFESMQELAGGFEGLETDEEWLSSVDKCLEYLNASKKELDAIELTTAEVKEIKKLFSDMLDSYIAGFGELKSGLENVDEALINSANEKIEKGTELLNEYNAALESLGDEKGVEIEY